MNSVAVLCSKVANRKLPTLPPLTAAEKSYLDRCDSIDLYYGGKGDPNYEKARLCALYQVSLPETDELPSDNGREVGIGILATIYTNGKEVPRDLDLAIAIACKRDAAPSADDGYSHMIQLIDDSRRDPSKPYDFCSTVGLDFWKIVALKCQGTALAREERRRQADLSNLAAAWSAEQKTALSSLLRARDAYEGASEDSDVELCITGTASEQMEVRQGFDELFAADMKEFVSGKLPHATHEEALRSDRRLNQTYRELIDGLVIEANKHGCAKPVEFVRESERAWIGYRDAWIKLATLRWSKVSADSWSAFFSDERTKHLGELIGSFIQASSQD